MIDKAQYQQRRQKLFDKMQDESIALIAAAPMQLRNGDTEYPYRQDSYFYYLTGFEESFAIVALVKTKKHCQFILFCQDRDPQAEQWNGPRAGISGAQEKFGAAQAYSINEASLRLTQLFDGLRVVYYMMGAHSGFDRKIFAWLDALRQKSKQKSSLPQRFIDLRSLLDEMRLLKTPAEQEIIRKSCEISTQAHLRAMRRCQVGMHEYELEAVLLHEFYRQGCRNVAYPSIVASGENSCTLHYQRNQSIMQDGQLVLIDAGGEYQGYASDITRTFPVNGKFSAPQQAIYEVVLAAQMAAIEYIQPDKSWSGIQETVLKVLVQGLVDLNILKGDVSNLIESKAYLPFYMHNSGHWMGLDVHDVGDYLIDNQSRLLKTGMVFTIEPGLYFAPHLRVPDIYKTIGVRIEDDILIKTDGVEVLTQAAPKKIDEIERIVGKSSRNKS